MKVTGWIGLALLSAYPAHAEKIGCVSTTFRSAISTVPIMRWDSRDAAAR